MILCQDKARGIAISLPVAIVNKKKSDGRRAADSLTGF